MNCVKELRLKKGIQQKELAISLNVSQAAVSDWENGKKNPKGQNLKKLADFFGVDEDFILGYGLKNPTLFIPDSTSAISQSEQIVQYVLERLNGKQAKESETIKTDEARILATGVDKLPKAQREQALNVVKAMFSQYADYFEKGESEE